MRPISIVVIVVALLIALTVVFYVRRWRLREQYSLLWIVLTIGMIVPAAWPDMVEWIADRLDVFYAPSILFFGALAFVAVMLFHYSLEISRLSDQNQRLAQELGILRAEVQGQAARPAGAVESEGSGGRPDAGPDG